MGTTYRNFTFDSPMPGGLNTIETRTGDLIVEGMAAVWQGLDREDENFIRGAFRDSIKTFLTRPSGAPLCWHHRMAMMLGQVTELRETDEGLAFKAIVPKQEKSSPLYWVYNHIRRGFARGVSVAGKFDRGRDIFGRLTIVRADLNEISLTPVPTHPMTFARASEVKALQDFAAGRGPAMSLDEAEAALRDLRRQMLVYELDGNLEKLRAAIS